MDIKKIKEIKDNTLTTSEVLQSSFQNVFKKLEKSDYVLVENKRKKETLVVQKLDNYSKEFNIPKRKRQTMNGKINNSNENILLAKTFIKENIYYLMKFESKNITFPQIETILNKCNLTKVFEFEKEITNNLMNGWKYILNTNKEFDFNSLLELHSLIAKDQALEFGHLRSGNITISGTSHVPSIPSKLLINNLFKEFSESKNIYKSSSILLAKLIKNQPFWDANKRTAFLTVNKFLINKAKGILIVNDNNFLEFANLLNDYYNDDSKLNNLVNFLMNNCFYNTLDKKLM